MKSIHIRDVPEETLANLKARAKNHHRSLQQEIHHLLEMASRMPLPSSQSKLDLHFANSASTIATWDRNTIYDDSQDCR